MASVPTLDFRPDDFTENGQFSAQKACDSLNKLSRLFREAMTHGITEDNTRTQDVTLTFTTGVSTAGVLGGFPLPAVELADYMPAQPTTVRVLYRRNLTTLGANFTTASDVDWVATGDKDGRKVSIRYISGLAASTRYQVTLRIEG